MRHPLFDRRVPLLLHWNSVARALSLDDGRCRWHLFSCDWRTEQLYSLGNAALETSRCWSALCDCYGACGWYPAEFDAWPAYLGLLFPAVQSVGPNLPAVYSAMVLPCATVYFCWWLAALRSIPWRATALSLAYCMWWRKTHIKRKSPCDDGYITETLTHATTHKNEVVLARWRVCTALTISRW